MGLGVADMSKKHSESYVEGQLAMQDAPVALEVHQPAPVQQSASTLEIFSALARDSSIPIDRIKQLMDMQRQAELWDAEKQFIAALGRLQPKLPTIEKKGKISFESQRTGTKQNTPYALYEDIDRIIRPLLHSEGLSIAFGTQPLEKGGLVITATLSHVGGHSRTESMPLPFDTSGSKNTVQAVGSTLSYGKRYLVCAMLNLITVGEDNDATGIDQISQDQQLNIEDLMNECRLTPEGRSKFLETFGVKTISDIQKGGYKAAVNLLVAKRRTLEEKK